MTAVVGILNKQAVAIAADSAVTIGGENNHKIFNKANKLFTLSKYQPVGVMIYNSASFMDTPWETLIKVYRSQLGKTSFPTVRGYQEDFIRFLRSKSFYTSHDLQIQSLLIFASAIIKDTIDNSLKEPLAEEDQTLGEQEKFLVNFEMYLDRLINFFNQKNDNLSDFQDYSFEMFDAYSMEIFEHLNNVLFTGRGINIPEGLILKTKQAVFSILIGKEDWTNYTGLIFTGFGEEEIYPQLIPLNISLVVDNRLRFYIDESNVTSISNSINGAVRPFAQTDVINTILRGIDPSLNNIYSSNFEKTFKKYNSSLLSSIGDSDPLLKQKIENLDVQSIVNEFNSLNREIIQEDYINPLMNAVSKLAKEDLAEMAESLIYLTYLKRRITFAEESVGGPVDVALISKGDGFVWIKRKHYFRPELNQHFFDNYFNK